MSISDLFIGTAAYYARYRVPYPDALFSMLRSEAHLSGCGRLLDLGCGTGEIAVTMSPDVREVWAVDVDAEMLREARARADRSGATNIKWIGCRAEDFEAPDAAWELVTIGAAYHWMDREASPSGVGDGWSKASPLRFWAATACGPDRLSGNRLRETLFENGSATNGARAAVHSIDRHGGTKSSSPKQCSM